MHNWLHQIGHVPIQSRATNWQGPSTATMQVMCPANLRAKDKNKHGFDFLPRYIPLLVKEQQEMPISRPYRS
ncbi:hypothetical protein Peur_010644 [Populus x canadensis]